MAELAAGALGGIATVGAVALTSGMSFTARHDHAYDCQTDIAQWLIDAFEYEFRQGGIDESLVEGYVKAKETYD